MTIPAEGIVGEVTAIAETADHSRLFWGNAVGTVKSMSYANGRVDVVKRGHSEHDRVLDIRQQQGDEVSWITRQGVLYTCSKGEAKARNVVSLQDRTMRHAALGTNVLVYDHWINARWGSTRTAVICVDLLSQQTTASPAVFPSQRGFNELVQHLELSPDQKTIAIVASGDFALMRPDSLANIRRFAQGWGVASAFSPSSELVALGTDGKGVFVWRVQDGRKLATFTLDKAATLHALAFSGEDTIYAASGPTSELYQLSVSTGEVRAIGQFPGTVKLFFSQAKRTLFVGKQDGSIMPVPVQRIVGR
ncbi:MAG: WD40 repeat domain-containing protein [Planctomycetaceae bacterium]|nr:hypothetical protein [Planctomycetaceae bacterium]